MSNAMNRDLRRLVKLAEDDQKARGGHGRFGQRLHLMPPTGWLNDPNGLCQRDGVFHAFFQYAPFDVMGGVKMWGHAVSRDLVDWSYREAPLLPDEPFDVHGVYSGSAVVEDGRIRVLYTGSVKLPDPDGVFDYVNAGRESGTVYVESVDGASFSEKRLVLTNADYPSDLTCHVRDPKVWRVGEGAYRMVLGARRRVPGPGRTTRHTPLHGPGAGTDRGEILVFDSPDMTGWRLVNRISTLERFGFMWECPDFFELAGPDGRMCSYLCCSPQGAEGSDWDRRNIYSAGYFEFSGELCGRHRLGDFHIWDGGFDFYAPQTFESDDGRRILIPWLGMPDAPDYGNDPTVAVGWQHCLGIPREVTVSADGTLLQRPIRELASRATGTIESRDALTVAGERARVFDLVVETDADDGLAGLDILIADGLRLVWLPGSGELPARFEMRFLDERRSAMGCGRKVRWEPVASLESIRVIGDASSIEVFVNGGALTMSTRYYPDRYGVVGACPGAAFRFSELA